MKMGNVIHDRSCINVLVIHNNGVDDTGESCVLNRIGYCDIYSILCMNDLIRLLENDFNTNACRISSFH